MSRLARENPAGIGQDELGIVEERGERASNFAKIRYN